ncbi:hypothetical protein MKW98_011476, partial [Papaver atlanticum]
RKRWGSSSALKDNFKMILRTSLDHDNPVLYLLKWDFDQSADLSLVHSFRVLWMQSTSLETLKKLLMGNPFVFVILLTHIMKIYMVNPFTVLSTDKMSGTATLGGNRDILSRQHISKMEPQILCMAIPALQYQ